MPILKYKPERIYNPKELKNQVRRATQFSVDRNFIRIPLTSQAMRLLMIIPGMKQFMKLIIKSGNKLIGNFEHVELSQSKEEQKCHYQIQ